MRQIGLVGSTSRGKTLTTLMMALEKLNREKTMPGPDEMNGAALDAMPTAEVCKGCGDQLPCQCDGMGNSQGPTAEAQAAIDRKTAELRALQEQHASVGVNGGAHGDPGLVQKSEALLDAQTRQVVGVVLRGIMVSAPGLAPDALCRSIARVTGSLLAEAVRADLPLMLKHRAGIKEAFKAGVDSTKVKTTPPAMPRKR